LAYINRRKFATCIVSPPTTIYVTTLPCEILIATLFMFTYIKQSTYYFGGNTLVNFCRNFMNINFKELYLINNILFVSSVVVKNMWSDYRCGNRWRNDGTDAFNQFMIAMDCCAVTNYL